MSEPAVLWLAALRLAPTTLGLGLAAGRAGVWGACWSLALLPLVRPTPGLAGASLGVRALGELLLGVALALALCGPLWAARHGGRLLDVAHAGSLGSSGVLGRIFGALALALFGALGGLRAFSRALVSESVPSLSPAASFESLALEVASLTTHLVRLSLTVAAPAWIALVLLDLSVSLVARLSGRPGHAIVGLAMPLRLLSVAVALPFAMHGLPEWLRRAAEVALRLLARPGP